jgi:hypothetical protein
MRACPVGSRRLRRAVAAAAVLAVVAGWPSPAGASTGALTVPLTSSVTTTGVTWVTVPMGRLRDPLNTFWQLFVRRSGATRWSLVTPPGVADNGGLVVAAAGPQSAEVGFEPSQLLTFSPLAGTADAGRSWSAGLTPSGLTAVPDALAAAGGTLVALVRTGAGAVLTAAQPTGPWTTLATARSLAAVPGAGCSAAAPSAVVLAGTEVVVGARCAAPGRVGVFARVGSRWSAIGPVLTGSLARSTASVARLVAVGTGLVATVALDAAGHRGVAVFTGPAGGGTWTRSAVLAVAPSTRLAATALTVDGDPVLLLETRSAGASGAAVLETLRGATWVRLPAPPAGVSAVAPRSDGGIDAFSVAGSRLTVSSLAPGASTWVRTQQLVVPIQYGSSD